MSVSEIVLAAGSAALGVAAGSIVVYFYSKNSGPALQQIEPTLASPEKKENTSVLPETSPITNLEDKRPSRTIPRSELDKSKRELRTLLLEKELVAAALTRLYEAEATKEITKDEREVLGAKYVAELKSLDDKISKMDAFIQIGDLETLRNQLLQLVNQKVEAIEKRIESTKRFAEPLIADMLQKQGAPTIPVPDSVDEKQRGTPIPDISDMLSPDQPQEKRLEPEIRPIEKQVTPVLAAVNQGSPPIGSADRRKPVDKAEELQKELLEALERLEKLDVETI